MLYRSVDVPCCLVMTFRPQPKKNTLWGCTFQFFSLEIHSSPYGVNTLNCVRKKNIEEMSLLSVLTKLPLRRKKNIPESIIRCQRHYPHAIVNRSCLAMWNCSPPCVYQEYFNAIRFKIFYHRQLNLRWKKSSEIVFFAHLFPKFLPKGQTALKNMQNPLKICELRQKNTRRLSRNLIQIIWKVSKRGRILHPLSFSIFGFNAIHNWCTFDLLRTLLLDVSLLT